MLRRSHCKTGGKPEGKGMTQLHRQLRQGAILRQNPD